MNILPVFLRNAIPVGIGLLIALVGLEWAGIIKASPVTYVTLGDLKSAPALLSLFGLGLISVLLVLNIALFFHPLIKMVGAGYPIGENVLLYPIIAPSLIIVGSMMLKNVTYITIGMMLLSPSLPS